MTSKTSRFLIWVFKSCLISKDQDDTHFYDLLGVPKSASVDTIRRAYRKTSLQYHPDKLQQRGLEVTEETRMRFQEINRAYEVLSDEKKRGLYDTLGEKGVKWVESPSSISMDEITENFLDSSMSARCNLIGFILFIIMFILLFPILLCAKVDGDTNASWGVVWLPIWIILSGLFMLKTVDLFEDYDTPPKEWDEIENGPWVNPSPLKKRLFEWLQDFLFFLFNILLVLKLDDNIDANWAEVFLPWIIWELLHIIEDYIKLQGEVPEVPPMQGDHLDLDREELKMKALHMEVEQFEAWRSIPVYFLRILFAILLMVKLDSHSGMSYGVVFLPCWFYLAIVLYNWSSDNKKIKEYKQDLPEMEGMTPPPLTPEQEETAAKLSLHYSAASGACCNFVLIIVMSSLIVSLADGDSFSSYWIFFPIFIIFGCIFCGACCFITCAGRIDEEGEGGAYKPPSEEDVLINEVEGEAVSQPPPNARPLATTPADTYHTFDEENGIKQDDEEQSKVNETSIHDDID